MSWKRLCLYLGLILRSLFNSGNVLHKWDLTHRFLKSADVGDSLNCCFLRRFGLKKRSSWRRRSDGGEPGTLSCGALNKGHYICWRLQLVICSKMKLVNFGRNPYQKPSGSRQICSVQQPLDRGTALLERWPVGWGFREHPAPAEVLSSCFPHGNSGLWILDELAITVCERFDCFTE